MQRPCQPLQLAEWQFFCYGLEIWARGAYFSRWNLIFIGLHILGCAEALEPSMGTFRTTSTGLVAFYL